MADPSVRQRKRPATDEAPRPRRRKPTPKVQQPPRRRHHRSSTSRRPSRTTGSRTPRRTRRLKSLPRERRASAPGADGGPGRTQKSVGRGLFYTGCGLLGRALCGRAHGVRTMYRTPRRGRRRRPSNRRDASLRVAQLMEGLNAPQFDPHALVACEAYGEKVEGAEAVEEEGKAALGRCGAPRRGVPLQ